MDSTVVFFGRMRYFQENEGWRTKTWLIILLVDSRYKLQIGSRDSNVQFVKINRLMLQIWKDQLKEI